MYTTMHTHSVRPERNDLVVTDLQVQAEDSGDLMIMFERKAGAPTGQQLSEFMTMQFQGRVFADIQRANRVLDNALVVPCQVRKDCAPHTQDAVSSLRLASFGHNQYIQQGTGSTWSVLSNGDGDVIIQRNASEPLAKLVKVLYPDIDRRRAGVPNFDTLREAAYTLYTVGDQVAVPNPNGPGMLFGTITQAYETTVDLALTNGGQAHGVPRKLVHLIHRGEASEQRRRGILERNFRQWMPTLTDKLMDKYDRRAAAPSSQHTRQLLGTQVRIAYDPGRREAVVTIDPAMPATLRINQEAHPIAGAATLTWDGSRATISQHTLYVQNRTHQDRLASVGAEAARWASALVEREVGKLIQRDRPFATRTASRVHHATILRAKVRVASEKVDGDIELKVTAQPTDPLAFQNARVAGSVTYRIASGGGIQATASTLHVIEGRARRKLPSQLRAPLYAALGQRVSEIVESKKIA